jgi:hypothetical protein
MSFFFSGYDQITAKEWKGIYCCHGPLFPIGENQGEVLAKVVACAGVRATLSPCRSLRFKLTTHCLTRSFSSWPHVWLAMDERDKPSMAKMAEYWPSGTQS